jgi:hypothetical protein
MLNWADIHAGAIQAITSVAIVMLTVILAWTTVCSTAITREAMKITRDQFNREWWIDLHVRPLDFDLGRNRAEDSVIRITNLGRTSVMVEVIKLRSGSNVAGLPVQVRMDLVIGGGILNDIPFSILKDALVHSFADSHPKVAGPSEWQTVREILQISLQCYSARQRYETNWVTFSAEFRTHPTYGTGIFKIGMNEEPGPAG